MLAHLNHFQQTRIYQNSVSLPALQKDLSKITEIDRNAEREQIRTEKIYRIGIWAIFIFLIGSIILTGGFVVGIFVLIPGFTTVCIYYQKSRKAAFLNLAQRRDRYRILAQLSDFWKKDASSQNKFKITLDLNPPDISSKLIHEKTLPRRKNGRIKIYHDSYLKVKGALLDGNKFYLQITEYYQTKTWMNVNRKYRFRPKKKGFNILLILSFSHDYDEILERLQQNLDRAVKLPKTVILKPVQLKPGKLHLKAKIPPQTSLQSQYNLLTQTVKMLFLSGYQILNLARMVNSKSA
jgi:hypothetical protein